MKISITGASNFVNRMFEACGPYQWAREFLKNSLEAGATKVRFGVEWQAVKKLGVYRRTIMDDGAGMSRVELERFFSYLGDGGKTIGGVHDNFGVGAKIASLPWNPEGVVVISYKDSVASMIHMVLEPESGDYELMDFQTADGTSAVVDPTKIDWVTADEIDWGALRPSWLVEHGTIVVLLGSTAAPDTILGNPEAGEKSTKGLSIYLNSRFWDLANVEVTVVELRSERKMSWPVDEAEKEDSKRPNNRRVQGAKYYLTDVVPKGAKLVAADLLLLDDERVSAEWYLWEGERPGLHTYARDTGYIAVRYKDELFEISSGKVQFRWFGVVESKVQQNLTIILEPQLLLPETGRWGVHPDQSRNRLLFTGDGEKGGAIPLHDWGVEFSQGLPEAIMNAIMAARGDLTGSLQDEEYRKRLQERFGSRWSMKQLVVGTSKATPDIKAAKETDILADLLEEQKGPRSYTRRKRSKVIKRLVYKAEAGGSSFAEERDVAVDVPKYRYGNKADFEESWHIAMWDESSNQVVLNPEAPVLVESVKYHQEQYADVYGEQVQQTIFEVFGEVAVSKIAHSQRLRRLVTDEILRDEYRNEKVLTVALMGLLAEESLIAQRLGKFGRKKAA